MSCCKSRNNELPAAEYDSRRFDRLRQTAALRENAFMQWRAGRVGVAGCGVLGSRLVPELVRSGIGHCTTFDYDLVSEENLGTQCFTLSGLYKTDALREQCNLICDGIVESRPIDIRHAGIGELAGLDAIVDCTDDPNLQWTLTEISNGLGIPMLRIAVDGSGERELGRVQVSHGGKGYACRLCSKSLEQLIPALPRTPCPRARPGSLPPSIVGSGIAMNVVGIALVQLQRLLGRKSDNQVFNSQIYVDLDNFQIIALTEHCSEKCISGHVTWDPITAETDSSGITFGELFDLAARLIGWAVDVIEPYNHALCLAARCECGETIEAIGTRWAMPPYCEKCHRLMFWELHTQKPSWTYREAKNADILLRTLAELGLPPAGAMILARKQDKSLKRIVLK
jgi:sulfur carrier protein ThiS adenylyltransferase